MRGGASDSKLNEAQRGWKSFEKESKCVSGSTQGPQPWDPLQKRTQVDNMFS